MEEEDDGVLWAEDDDGEDEEENDVLKSVFSRTETSNDSSALIAANTYYDNEKNNVEDEVNSLFAQIDDPTSTSSDHPSSSSGVPLLAGSRYRRRRHRKSLMNASTNNTASTASRNTSSTSDSSGGRKRQSSRQRRHQLRQQRQKKLTLQSSSDTRDSLEPLEDLLQELAPNKNPNDLLTQNDQEDDHATSSQEDDSSHHPPISVSPTNNDSLQSHKQDLPHQAEIQALNHDIPHNANSTNNDSCNNVKKFNKDNTHPNMNNDQKYDSDVPSPPKITKTMIPNTNLSTTDNSANINMEDDFDNGIQWGSIDFDAMEQQANHTSSHPHPQSVSPQDHNKNDNNSTIQNNNNNNNNGDDEYGDFPIMDFEEFDNLIATNQQQLTQKQQQNTLHTVTPTNIHPQNIHPPFSYTPYIILDIQQNIQSLVQILHVQTNHPPNDNGHSNNHKFNLIIHLRDEWFHTPCKRGDVFHLISPSGISLTHPQTPDTIITLDSNTPDLWLILHPQLWLTPTLISDTLECTRRSTLSYRCPSYNTTNISALMGSMRHELFQCCLQHNNISLKFCQQQIRHHILPSMATQLLSCTPPIFNEYPTPLALEQALLQTLPQLQQFYYNYIQNANSISGLSHTCHNFQGQHVHAMEECTASPELGLKGNIDVTVLLPPSTYVTQSNNHQNMNHHCSSSKQQRSRFMPIELKTGHSQNTQSSHMAQLSLYILLLQARYNNHNHDQKNSDNDDLGGMLLYLNHQSYGAHYIHPSQRELASLIGLRNSLANSIQHSKQKSKSILLQYESNSNNTNKNDDDEQNIISKRDIAKTHSSIAAPLDLPELIPHSRTCDYCFSNRECMLYDAVSNVNSPPAIMGAASDSSSDNKKSKMKHHFTGHLTKLDKKYFVHWDTWIDLEEQCKPEKHWWLQKPEQSSSDYISLLTWDQSFVPSKENSQDRSSTIIKFNREGSASFYSHSSQFSLDKGSIWVLSTNDHLSQRNERGRKRPPWMNLLRGSLVDYDDGSVFIRTSQRDVYNLEKLILSFGNDNTMMFRLDKFESMHGGAILRRNLIQLMTGDINRYSNSKSQPSKNDQPVDSYGVALSNRIQRLRKLIIHMEKPRFELRMVSSMFRSSSPRYPGCHIPDLVKEYARLNSDQKNAVAKVICAKDYALVQGLPGTGKTSTIAFLTRLLVARGKRVLITSYTHAAVDNLLLKLKQCGISSDEKILVRIGTKQSTHLGVHDLLFPNNDEELSAWTLHKNMSQAMVVGVTALTIPKSPLLVGQHFDVVIVDEAGQISQPAIIGALNAADQFILVGDHEQLPPLVKSSLPEQTGYGISMLKRLAVRHPDAVAKLTIQYRMHEDISKLCNIIVYKGELKTPVHIRRQSLVLRENPPEDSWWHQSRIFNPDHAVIFLNTDSTGFHEILRGRRNSGMSIVNMVESQIICSLVKTLLSCGLEAKALGIISPFRSQVNLLCDDPNLERESSLGLEISTIDRYQGRDKEVVILSLVRSNKEGKCSRLLKDYRRLNVAFSRAKKKLIMVGSFETLRLGSHVLHPVLDDLKRQGIVEDIPNHLIKMN